MFSFRAYFWNNDVYINETNKYAANEILTAYLNTDYFESAEDMRYEITLLKNKLLISEDMSYDTFENYNKHVYRAIKYFEEINSWLRYLPPYNQIMKTNPATLDDVLNEHSFFLEDGLDDYDDEIYEGMTTEFGIGETDDRGRYYLRLHKFQPHEEDRRNNYTADMLDSLNEMNEDITKYFDGYIAFLESYIAIQKTFLPFVEQYLHRTGTFPTANEAALYFENFNKENGNTFKKFKCKMESFRYKVLNDENNKPILCEEIYFTDLQSFLFYDFFNGIKKNYIPNQCKQCDSFFLIRAGKYFSYCDKPLGNEPDKTCRDVGARRRYDDKCKNDPVWQTYNRAYKAHYARYMKKKMTVSEFEKWSRFASDLRDQALAETIPFEQYYAEIRK